MKKLATAIAVTALGAAIAFAAPQQDGGKAWGHGHGHGRHGVFGQQLAEKLNLTDAQKEQWHAIKKDSRAQNAEFFKQSHETMQAFRAAKESGDTAKADSLKATVDAQRAQMKQIRDAEDQKLMAILNAEQRAQYQAIKAERAAHFGEHGGKNQ